MFHSQLIWTHFLRKAGRAPDRSREEVTKQNFTRPRQWDSVTLYVVTAYLSSLRPGPLVCLYNTKIVRFLAVPCFALLCRHYLLVLHSAHSRGR